MSDTTKSLGVTEITNDDAINEFLGLTPPKVSLEGVENQAVPLNTNTVKIDDKDIQIDENELFGILPLDNKTKETKKDEKTEGQEEGLLNEVSTEVNEDDIFSQLGEGLSKLGVITTPETADFKWTQDSFIEQLETAKLQGANDIVQDHLQAIENGEEIFKALFIDKLPIESFASYTKSIIDYNNIDLTETAGENLKTNQERIVRDYLKNLNFDDNDINAQVEYLKDTEKIADAANTYKTKLIERTAKQREDAILEARALEQDKIKEKEAFLTSMATELRAAVKNKEIDGIPISESEANELFLYATKNRWVIPSTKQEISDFDKALMEMRKDPKTFIKLAKLVKNNLEIKDAVKKQSSKENAKIFNNLKQAAKVSNAKTDEDPFLKLFGK